MLLTDGLPTGRDPACKLSASFLNHCAELLAVGRQLSNITFLAAVVHVEAVSAHKRNVKAQTGPSCSRR